MTAECPTHPSIHPSTPVVTASSAPSYVATVTHTRNTHTYTPTMLAHKMSITAKATTTTVVSKKTTSRGQTIVRKNSKGGEEGARAVRRGVRRARASRRALASRDGMKMNKATDTTTMGVLARSTTTMRSVRMRASTATATARARVYTRNEFFSDYIVRVPTGMIAKAASYSLFGAAITKVRARSRRNRWRG